jgi:hypothetical protein
MNFEKIKSKIRIDLVKINFNIKYNNLFKFNELQIQN